MIKLFESYNKEKEILDWLEKFDENFYTNEYTISNGGIIDVCGAVDISKKNLKSILYKFGEVTGFFSCSDNKLTSLQYAPVSVGGSFYCQRNKLTSLQYAPASVGGDFICYENQFRNLGDLVGLPKSIGGKLYCYIPEADIFGKDLLSHVILPNYGEFEAMDVIYVEAGIKYYQPNAFRKFLRQESPSTYSTINYKEIGVKFGECGYVILN
jgi:hypothetical protein